MAAVDGPIIDALPFESARAEFPYSNDGAYIYFVANRRIGGVGCEWRSATGSSLIVSVMAGASWVVDEGRFTPQGSEINVAGADRAWLVTPTGGGQVLVTFVVDRSLAFVNYQSNGEDSADVDAVLAVVAAVIASGPRV
jgi:hypothetical protein